MDIICKHCGKVISNLNDIRMREDGEYICFDCAREHYVRCNNCSNYISKTENRMICLECDDIVYKCTCNSYNTKPIPRFKTSKKYLDKNDLYYGMEIEINNVNQLATKILFKDLYDSKMIYNKSDSSIYDGVEIVTNPCDYKTINKLLDSMKEGLSKIKETCRGTDKNAGVHIHISRSAVSPIDLYKLSYLFNYDSSSLERRILYYICGRNKQSTCTTSQYHYCQIGINNNIRESFSTGDRYRALNLNNTTTIEFRLFKTNLNVDVLKMYVEFVNLSIQFCHTHGLKDISVNNFIVWLLNNTINKIILKKINNFKKYNGNIEHKVNTYTISNQLLKGINIDKYPDLLFDLKRTRNIKDIDYIISKHKSMTSSYRLRDGFVESNFGKKCKLVPLIEKTLKKVYINKITKGLEKECA